MPAATEHQRYCDICRRETHAREAADARRNIVRFPRAKALDSWGRAA